MARRRDRALDFVHWFRKSKFDLMRDFVSDLGRPPVAREPAALERRFLAALRHAKRVLVARLVVTLLLAAGVLATASAALARVLYVPTLLQYDVAAWLAFLDKLAAFSGAATLVLIVARLAFDRYLDLVQTSATFLAIQMASCER